MKIGEKTQNMSISTAQRIHVTLHLLLIWNQNTSLKRNIKYYQHQYHLVMLLLVLISWHIICILIIIDVKMGKNPHELYTFICQYWHVISHLTVILDAIIVLGG